MATQAPVAYECGCAHQDDFDAKVLECFRALGARDPEAMAQQMGIYLGNAKRAGIEPGIAAAIAYSTATHMHPVAAVGAALPAAGETPKAKDYYAVVGHKKEGPFRNYHEAKTIADQRGGYVEFAGEKVEDHPEPEAAADRDIAKALVSHADVRKAPWRVTLLTASGKEVGEATDDSLMLAFAKATLKAKGDGHPTPAWIRDGFEGKYGALPNASQMRGAYFGEWPAPGMDERAAEYKGKKGRKPAKMKLGISGEEAAAEDCVGVHTHTPIANPEVVVVAGETPMAPEMAAEDRPAVKGKPRKLHWHRGEAEGVYHAEGHLGRYEIVRRSPDRRHGILPHQLLLNGKPVGERGFDSKGEAQDFAASYDMVMPYAAPGESDVRIEDGRALVKGAKIIDGCLPWVRVTKDPERFSSCLAAAQKIGAIDSGAKVYELLAPYLQSCDQEVFLVVLLDVQQKVRGVAEVARGQRSKVYVDPADVLRPVIITGASAFWVAHNHPSSKAEPSPADRRLTKAIEKASKVAAPDVEFEGHIVIGGEPGQGQWGDADTGKVHKA